MKSSIIVSENLILTEIRATDLGQLVALLNDETIFENTLMIPFPYTEGDAEWFINMNRELESKHGFVVNYAIRATGPSVSEADAPLIGVIGRLMKEAFGGAHKDEIGYWLGRPYWNRGYASRVIRAFTEHCFDNAGLERVEAHVYAPNVASQRALEKAGFAREGYIRKFYFKPQDGKFRDAVIFGKIKGDA